MEAGEGRVDLQYVTDHIETTPQNHEVMIAPTEGMKDLLSRGI